LALLYGVQPVVSTYNIETGSSNGIYHKTPFGWENVQGTLVQPGCVAGNGGRTLVSSPAPINYGQDGKFYSYAGGGGSYIARMYQNGAWVNVGPTWSFGLDGYYGSVSADVDGVLYAGTGISFGRASGSSWVQPTEPGADPNWWQNWYPIKRVSQVAVSPFGEVAISGYSNNNEKLVVWYDSKASGWFARSLGSSNNMVDTIGLRWDQLGNLGVAYSNQNTLLMFDYLDKDTDLWTRETVLDVSGAAPVRGAALEFDRLGRPVIASGSHLVYDPPAVPEPMTLLVLGLGGLAAWVRGKGRV